ncbi:MAG: gluconate 2-dehydrogenase subunit 3 family protein [Caulobacterales bacterium]|jgi:hypothetical protein
MDERYPGYDVLAKRRTPSWDEATRQAIDQRLAVHPGPRFFTAAEWRTLRAVCARIVPEPPGRTPVPTQAYIDEKLFRGLLDGYRNAGLPPQGEAWRRGLRALEAEARAASTRRFHQLEAAEQDGLLRAMQAGQLKDAAWGDMACELFFSQRLLTDITRAYYAHPTAWSDIGFGGPASPRGYVRLAFDRRDPWEASESRPGRALLAQAENRRVGRR